jgi:hypothetical protein
MSKHNIFFVPPNTKGDGIKKEEKDEETKVVDHYITANRVIHVRLCAVTPCAGAYAASRAIPASKGENSY